MVFLGYVCFPTIKNKEDSNSLHYIQNKVFLLICSSGAWRISGLLLLHVEKRETDETHHLYS